MNREQVLKIVADARARGEVPNLHGANLTCADLHGADLRNADLRNANLTRANLSGADLSGAKLTRANLSGAKLTRANLSGAKLTRADLTRADLSGAKLTRADLSGAKLTRANLSGADLSGAKLTRANLSGAKLAYADLSGADLSGANLTRADLSGANLSGANLSGAKGLLDPSEWMEKNFEATTDGYVVYKRIGKTYYPSPAYWKIEPGSILKEVCNPDRCTECGCGVNFGTLGWCRRHPTDAVLWKCLIRWKEDSFGVVVPYNTEGKARCGSLMLVAKV